MPGPITLPIVTAALSGGRGLLLQLPSATTQILASAVLTLLIVFGVVCLRQSGAGRRWAGLLNAGRDNGRARRQESTKRDQPAAPAQKPPPPGRDNSDGPSPR